MPAPPRLSSPRYRRRILAAGLIAAGALFSFVAPVYIGRIEDDLEQRVPEELAEAGFDGVTAEFSGQDGTLTCTAPLDDPEAATDAAYDVWGVRAVTLDRSCRVNVAPGSSTGEDGDDSSQSESSESESSQSESSAVSALTSGGGESAAGSTATSAADYATLADLLAEDRRFSYLTVLLEESGMASLLDDPSAAPVTVFAPTDAAFEKLSADANAQLRSDPAVLDHVLEHHVTAGALTSGDLVTGPYVMLDDGTVAVINTGSAITVDGSRLVDTDLMAGNGVVHVVDDVLLPADVDLDTQVVPEPTTTTPTVVTTGPPGPTTPTSEQAAALTAELNAYVATDPIRFAAGQAVLAPESEAVLDHVASRILELPGVSVTVVGHTDSDGTPDRNLALSRQRAEAVLLALVARGLADVPISAVGFGSQQPVLVDGVEDKDASRRVEFLVEVAP